jgi:hypothetical protein
LFWRAAAPYLILAVLSAAFLYPFVRVFSDVPDYGVFLNGADLLNRGAVPSRDFVEPQGPGSFLWLALFFRLFGTTFETARGLLNATGVGLGLLAFHLSRRLGARGLFAVLFVLLLSIPLLPINSPHYDSNLFALGALAVFLPAWDQCRKGLASSAWRLTTAAMLCGVTTWMIQQKGLYLMAALLVSLAWLRRKHALRPGMLLLGVYGSVVLLPFAVLAALHALPDVLYANYIWPMATYSDLNACPYGFPIWHNLAVSLRQDANQPAAWLVNAVSAVPFFVVAALPVLLPLAAACAGKRWFSVPLLPYWLAGYALWLAELHRLDMGHLRNGVVLLALLFFSICEAAGNPALRRIGFASTLCLVLAGAANFMTNWDAGRPIQTRRGDLYLKGDQKGVRSLLVFLETHTQPGDDVFVYPYQPIYYFAEKLKNPTRYSYLQYHLHTAAQFEEATRDLGRKPVRYVVFDTLLSGQQFTSMFPNYRQPDQSHLIMEPYLEAQYRMVNDLGRFHILEEGTTTQTPRSLAIPF